ncbi:MAG: leucyl aminopeptidase family protein [Lachnospiraceae bacterium]|nr:leucyl aminopeptidase family protein [Lachnospiraceae bacterium]
MEILYSTESVPEMRTICFGDLALTDPLKLRQFFRREGKTGQEDVQILLDMPECAGKKAEKLADLIVISLYEGAYRFQKECLKEWDAERIFTDRDKMADYGGRTITLVSETDLRGSILKAQQAAYCMGYARTLGNLPHNYLQIPDMVRYAQDMAASCGLTCTVYGDRALRELGCGGILAVNQGSDNEAALVMLEWGSQKTEDKIALVGKGLMFDAGGYHLKSLDGMNGMKFDMCGAANMLESMEIAAKSDYPGPLLCVLGLAENLISPKAVKMGDVVSMLSGSTVEVYNTDAEGRLVLGDALTFAQRLGAVKVIDLATLTGGTHSALGDETVGIFSNHEDIYGMFEKSMKAVGERCWRLPLGEIYRQALCWSDTADLANYAPGFGAAGSTGAAFLEFFIEPGTQWVHLDVVGPASARSESEERTKGATDVCMSAIRKWLEIQLSGGQDEFYI